MNRATAQWLGAAFGIIATVGSLLWLRTREKPCTGAVFIEFHPPLSEPGVYRFRLSLDDRKPCSFEVPLPTRGKVDTKACQLVLSLATQVDEGRSTISRLTVGAAPEHMRLEVWRGAELIYDAPFEPRYGPYETRREDSRMFCGDRAFVTPPCRTGSSQCTPFEARCSGAADCPERQSCCLNAERGRWFGSAAASNCGSRNACLAGFGQIACKSDAECPKDMRCGAHPSAAEFKGALQVCSPK